MGKIKTIELTSKHQEALENGYRNGTSHAFRMRCKAVLLKAQGLSSPKIGEQLDMHQVSVQLGKTLPDRGHRGSENQAGTRTQANYWHGGRGNHPTSNRKRSFKSFVSQGTMGSSYRQDSMRGDSQTFLSALARKIWTYKETSKGGNPRRNSTNISFGSCKGLNSCGITALLTFTMEMNTIFVKKPMFHTDGNFPRKMFTSHLNEVNV